MSWFGGYKPKLSEPESRELRRQKLEAERLKRKEDREIRQKQLLAAQKSRQEADQAIPDLLNLEPDILTKESVEFSDSVDFTKVTSSWILIQKMGPTVRKP